MVFALLGIYIEDFVFIVLREQTPDKRKQIIGYMLENMPDVVDVYKRQELYDSSRQSLSG